VFTPASTIDDEPTTFEFQNQTYTPGNFKHEFLGEVKLRQGARAFAQCRNREAGRRVGYDNVVALAHRAGLNDDIKATPAVALGAYQVTLLEIANAYTMFADGGTRVKPNFIDAIRSHEGETVYDHEAESYRVLDPRVAFIMTDMLQEVMRSGTTVAVRARGFKLPAAGKTGRSHDGWFAGYTSLLPCIVWVDSTIIASCTWTGGRGPRSRGSCQRTPRRPFCPGGEPDYFIPGTQPTEPCPDPLGEAERATPLDLPASTQPPSP